MKLSLGVPEEKVKNGENKILKKITWKKFEKQTKEYVTDSFSVIINSSRMPDAPLS